MNEKAFDEIFVMSRKTLGRLRRTNKPATLVAVMRDITAMESLRFELMYNEMQMINRRLDAIEKVLQIHCVDFLP